VRTLLHLGDVDAGHVNLLLALWIPEQYGVDSVENKLRLSRRLLQSTRTLQRLHLLASDHQRGHAFALWIGCSKFVLVDHLGHGLSILIVTGCQALCLAFALDAFGFGLVSRFWEVAELSAPIGSPDWRGLLQAWTLGVDVSIILV